jgi:serine/threonine protein kinase
MLSNNAGFTLFSANQIPKMPSAITIKSIPYVPPSVDMLDLRPDGKLLDDKAIKTTMKTCKDKGRFSKNFTNTLYSIYKDEKDLFAICPNKIGEGGSSRVKGLQNQNTKQFAALKIMSINIPQSVYTNAHMKKLFTQQKNKIEYEMEKEYQNLLRVNQAITSPFSRESYSKNEWQMIMIMKLAEGISLDTVVESKFADKIPALTWIQIAIDLIDALIELHTKHNMLHLDFKPGNVVYNLAEKRATLIDFGYSGTKDANGKVYTNRPCGTPLYMSARIRKKWMEYVIATKQMKNCLVISKTHYDNKADISSLGTTLAALFGLFYPPTRFEDFDPDNNYIAKAGHPLYDNNKRIGHPMLLASIVRYLERMTSVNEDNVPNLFSVKNFFLSIKALALTACPQIKVAFMNVDEYLNASAYEKVLLKYELMDADEVRFYDVKARDDMVYMELKAELEEKIPIVGPHVAISKDLSILEKSLSQILDNENGGKLSGYYGPYIVSKMATKDNDNCNDSVNDCSSDHVSDNNFSSNENTISSYKK